MEHSICLTKLVKFFSIKKLAHARLLVIWMIFYRAAEHFDIMQRLEWLLNHKIRFHYIYNI